MTRHKLLLANNPLLSGPALAEREKTGIPYREIPVELIERDANQPRVNFDDEKLKELADSIRIYGVLSPILVKPGKSAGKFTLIAGERRLRAAQIAGLSIIPALVDQDEDDSDTRTLAMQLVENLQRTDLTPLERAHAIGALRDSYNLSIRDIAAKLGVSKSMVQRSLDVLELPDDLLNALREGASESKVLTLSRIEDPAIRASYLKDLETTPRTQIEKELEKQAAKGRKSAASNLTPEDLRIVDEIQRAVGLRVKMVKTSPEHEAGKVIIEFYSNQDLQLIFRKLVADQQTA
jgi:ParB family chromosome partitioning protein